MNGPTLWTKMSSSIYNEFFLTIARRNPAKGPRIHYFASSALSRFKSNKNLSLRLSNREPTNDSESKLRHSGISLAFAARLRRFGSRLTGKPSQYDTARHLWPSALRYFKTSQELPASLRIVMENIINRPLHTSPDEMHLLPAAANSDYYFLYAPFFEEHYGFAPAVALSSAVSSLTAALGSSPGSTSNAATSPSAPLVAAAGPIPRWRLRRPPSFPRHCRPSTLRMVVFAPLQPVSWPPLLLGVPYPLRTG